MDGKGETEVVKEALPVKDERKSRHNLKCTLLIIGVAVLVSVVSLAYVLTRPDPEETIDVKVDYVKVDYVSDDFCVEFGRTDAFFENILNNFVIDNFTISGESVEAVIFSNEKELKCIPEFGFSTELIEEIQGRPLVFDNCPIKAVNPLAFQNDGFQGATDLILRKTDLDFLPDNIFDKFTGLTVFSLAGSHFRSFETDIFGGFSSLAEVDLSGAFSLLELPNFVADQTELESLNMSFTTFESIDKEIFGNLASLEIFDVTGSVFSEFSASEVSFLVGVEESSIIGAIGKDFCVTDFLDLSDIEAREEVSEALVLDVSTETVLLDSFFTRCFPFNSFGAFDGADIATISSFINATLILDAFILEIHPAAFRGSFLSVFSTLRLVGSITLRSELTEGIFADFTSLTKLEMIDLRESRQIIDADILGPNCGLKEFRLIETFDILRIPSFIKNCPDLEIVDLRRNGKLVSFQEGLLENVPNIKEVILTDTPIATQFSTEELARLLRVDENVIVL